jgi:hypothetical protein
MTATITPSAYEQLQIKIRLQNNKAYQLNSERVQYFLGGCWVGNNPKRFFRRTLCLEYLSSGEKRAAAKKVVTKID